MPNNRIYWLHTLSPTHVGVGRGVGYIDQPIDRDGLTGWPIIRGSAFKGVLADHHRADNDARLEKSQAGQLRKAAFGIAGDENNSNAGALVSTDAKIVCLPVRSLRGTFAWATSPLCLNMLHRTLKLAGMNIATLPPVTNLDQAVAHLAHKKPLCEGDSIYLEDLDFKANECPKATAWADWISKNVFGEADAWGAEFKKRFAVIPDEAFDFLCETGTEVHTRVRINDETKTVAKGALWSEESLPAETILMGFIQCDRIFGNDGKEIETAELLNKFASAPLNLQIGGKATVGRGQVRCVFTPTEVKS